MLVGLEEGQYTRRAEMPTIKIKLLAKKTSDASTPSISRVSSTQSVDLTLFSVSELNEASTQGPLDSSSGTPQSDKADSTVTDLGKSKSLSYSD